jgi:large subunit ribosomal protein L10
MARPEKIAEVQAITDGFQSSQSIVMADFTGLSVHDMTEFRARCREINVQCRVVKNRLARIAADNADLGFIKDHLTGPTALVMGPESQVDPAKLVAEFAKDHEQMQVKGGMVEGQLLDAEQVIALSKVPSKDELIAKMMGSINSPASGIVGTVSGVMGALARAIDAVSKQKAEAA